MKTIKQAQTEQAEYILKLYGSTLVIEPKRSEAQQGESITGYNIYNKQQETLNLGLKIVRS